MCSSAPLADQKKKIIIYSIQKDIFGKAASISTKREEILQTMMEQI